LAPAGDGVWAEACETPLAANAASTNNPLNHDAIISLLLNAIFAKAPKPAFPKD
jgi:hypothetical protein